MKLTTRKLVITALLASLILIFGFTAIGYIPIPPVKITLLCLPVIIGTIMEGLIPGLILSLFFIGTSFAQLFIDPLSAPFLAILNDSPIDAFYICCIIVLPRLLVPITTWLVYRAIARKDANSKRIGTGAGVAALVGSLTNTIFFLGLMYLLVGTKFADKAQILPTLIGGVIAMIGLTNGLPEAAFNVFVTIPIVLALKKVYLRTKPKQQLRS